jgi:translocation and assembly module TamB
MLRKIKKAFLFLLIMIMALLLLAAVLINLPFAHRFITGWVNNILVNAQVPIIINSIGTILPNSVAVHGVYLHGDAGDTIIYAEALGAAIAPLALLQRKVIIPSAFISNSSVRFLRQDEDVGNNIAEAFSNIRGKTRQKEKNGKQSWEVSIGSVDISGLKFQMVDSVAGIYIDQEVVSLKARMNEMSIIRKAILVQSLDINEATGTYKISTKPEVEKSAGASPWNYGLANLSLMDINIIVDDPVQRSLLKLSFEDCIVKTRKSDINNKTFDFRKVSLSGAGISLQIDERAGKLKEFSPDKSASFPWDINCENLDLENVFLGFGDYNDGMVNLTEPAFGMNKLDMRLSDIRLNSYTAAAEVSRISFDLNNGCSVKRIKGELDSQAGTTLLSLYLETENSLVNFDGSAEGSFFDLIATPERTGLANASISKSMISLKDLVCFKPDLLNQPFINTLAMKPFSMDGIIILRDSAISLSAVSVSQAPDFRFTAEGKINNPFRPEKTNGTVLFGIPDINTSWLTKTLEEVGFKKNIPDFSTLTVEGNLSDSLMSPDFMLKIKSDLGNIDLSGSFDINHDSFKMVSQFERIKLDRVLNNAELGSFSGSGEIAGNGIKHKSITADATLSVDSLRFKGYDYSNGKIACKIRPSMYDFSFMIDDPALRLDLTAGINSTDSLLAINTSGAFMAKINKLHLIKDTIDLEGSLAGDLKKGINSFKADLRISDLALITPQKKMVAGPLNTSLRSDTLLTSLSGQSGFYNLDVQIEEPLYDLKSIIPGYRNYIGSLLDSLTMNPTMRNSYLPGITAKININHHEVFDMILKGLHFDYIDLELINSPSNESLHLTILGRDINYEMLALGILNTRVTDSAGVINLQVATDSSTLFSHPVNRLLLTSHLANGQGIANLSIIDRMNEMVYDFEISSEADSNHLYFKVPSKQLTMNGVQWQMDAEELLSYDLGGKWISPSLKMHTDNSSIQLMGEGNEFDNLLTCDLSNVSVTSLLPENIIRGNPGGQISGSVSYNSFGENGREIKSDLIFSDLRWSDVDFNNLELKGQYKSEKPGYFRLEAYSRLDSAEIVLKAEKRGGGSRIINAELTKFPINTLEPFVKKYLSALDGSISGNLNIASSEEIENINGELLITKGKLRINTLNSAYKIPEEKIGFTGGKILLDNFTVLDSLNNKLFVNGSIDFTHPKVIYTDLDILSSDLQVMNRRENDNSTFFGRVFVDSKLSVKGPLTNPDLKGKILLTGGTEIFYSMKEDLSLSESEKVITFVSDKPLNDKEQLSPIPVPAMVNNTTVKTLVEIDPQTRINFNLSQRMYVIDLRIQGGGTLNYNLLENNQMNLSGKYEIGEGRAYVKMIGWPSKQFRIASGGFIRWDGNIEDPTLKFEAISKVRSSYTNPVDGKIRDVDVNVVLKISDRLAELNLTFTINTPDQYLMSIINTLSPEEQMRQAITILLFERIDLPGISTSTDYVTEQVNQILASQLNQFTKTNIKGVDISFGIDSYKSATATGGEQTNTSLSYDVEKALFNDRGKIQISGRVNDYSNQQRNSNLSLNNFSFEYQLDSSATKFVKVYNEHTYEDVFDGEVIKTGMGFLYRKSYPSLGDLWRRNGKKKKSKETGK